MALGSEKTVEPRFFGLAVPRVSGAQFLSFVFFGFGNSYSFESFGDGFLRFVFRFLDLVIEGSPQSLKPKPYAQNPKP